MKERHLALPVTVVTENADTHLYSLEAGRIRIRPAPVGGVSISSRNRSRSHCSTSPLEADNLSLVLNLKLRSERSTRYHKSFPLTDFTS